MTDLQRLAEKIVLTVNDGLKNQSDRSQIVPKIESLLSEVLEVKECREFLQHSDERLITEAKNKAYIRAAEVASQYGWKTRPHVRVDGYNEGAQDCADKIAAAIERLREDTK